MEVAEGMHVVEKALAERAETMSWQELENIPTVNNRNVSFMYEFMVDENKKDSLRFYCSPKNPFLVLFYGFVDIKSF